jgi:hypothetical protein
LMGTPQLPSAGSRPWRHQRRAAATRLGPNLRREIVLPAETKAQIQANVSRTMDRPPSDRSHRAVGRGCRQRTKMPGAAHARVAAGLVSAYPGHLRWTTRPCGLRSRRYAFARQTACAPNAFQLRAQLAKLADGRWTRTSARWMETAACVKRR